MDNFLIKIKSSNSPLNLTKGNKIPLTFKWGKRNTITIKKGH